MSIDDTSSASGPTHLATGGWVDPERELTSSVALFEGDEGGLELPQRRVLVALLKQRFITAQSHPKEWKTLTANPRPIRSRLNDVFLDLHLDTGREVACKRQVVPEGGGRFPTLLHDTAWTREETILLVYLRTRGRSEEAAGTSRTFVDRQDMLEHVATLRPEHATDHAGDGRRAVKAVESLNRAGLLIGASTADRFEVSSAIDVVLPLERLQDLLRWLKARNTTDHSTGAVVSLTGHDSDPDTSDDGISDEDSP
jgi:Domain of unknown function (DUF4194)